VSKPEGPKDQPPKGGEGSGRDGEPSQEKVGRGHETDGLGFFKGEKKTREKRGTSRIAAAA